METGTSAWERILISTFVVGALDISEVTVFYGLRGVAPMRILQSVATGWLGKGAFKGGLPTALLGLATHFLIATVVVSVYYFASRKISLLRTRPVVIGALYGLAVYAFMNFVVLPLSASGAPKLTPIAVANGLFAHLFCVGIPTALMTTRQRE